MNLQVMIEASRLYLCSGLNTIFCRKLIHPKPSIVNPEAEALSYKSGVQHIDKINMNPKSSYYRGLNFLLVLPFPYSPVISYSTPPETLFYLLRPYITGLSLGRTLYCSVVKPKRAQGPDLKGQTVVQRRG